MKPSSCEEPGTAIRGIWYGLEFDVPRSEDDAHKCAHRCCVVTEVPCHSLDGVKIK